MGLIAKNQQLPNETEILLQINNIDPAFIDSSDLTKLLKNIYKALEAGAKLPNSAVE